MSIFMTVYKCICMHEYVYVCMYACMYCVRIYVCACIYVYCVYACLYICMQVCIHVCIHVYVIFKLDFERYGENCPSWEGELSGGNCPGRKMSVPPIDELDRYRWDMTLRDKIIGVLWVFSFRGSFTGSNPSK